MALASVAGPTLAALRAGVLASGENTGAGLVRSLSDAYDLWLSAALPARPGVALAAVGSLGRREQTPYSDLDLVLLYRKGTANVQAIADALWYPIWDSGLLLDHSVRTPDEALGVARDDLKAMLGLLDLRHLAGDETLTATVRTRAVELWRKQSGQRLPELHDLSIERWRRCGEAAFLLEPDLKDSRGGLRDWHALQALAAAQLLDVLPAARAAAQTLLAVRAELHRILGRAGDVLRLQEQSAVADALGMADDDELLRTVNQAGRTLSRAVDAAWRRVLPALPPRRRIGLGRVKPPARVPLAADVVGQGGEVVLALSADPALDPVLVLRVARAAAEHAMPIAPITLERLCAGAPLPEPWPPAAREALIGLLSAGERAVAVFEALDEVDLLTRLVPEWSAVRFKAQRNPVHRFTVDRHLLETAAQAAPLTRRVERPDLLLVGALLHDIGKGYPGDHSVVGAQVVLPMALRMGFPPVDAQHIAGLVRHHLLLPDTATRRDPDDPATIAIVSGAMQGSGEFLEELHALTIADAAATGPGAWSEWKAGLIRTLVHRVHADLEGKPPVIGEPLDDRRRALAQQGALAVEIDGDQVIIAAPDAVGVLSRSAAVLALHSLDVRTASIATHLHMAVNVFTVAPRFGRMPEPSRLSAELAGALNGTTDLRERLLVKALTYPTDAARLEPPPRVLWFDDEATDRTIVELRAADSFALLHHVTAAIEQCGLDVHAARLSTLGSSVVDAFYVTAEGGHPVAAELRPGVTAAMLAAAVRDDGAVPA